MTCEGGGVGLRGWGRGQGVGEGGSPRVRVRVRVRAHHELGVEIVLERVTVQDDVQLLEEIEGLVGGVKVGKGGRGL